MAKDKSATAERKAERKAEKKALKAEKLAKKQAAATSKAGGAGPTGVTKAKGENKEKKTARKVLAEKALSELKGKGNEKIKSEAEDQDEQESGEDEDEDEEMEEQNGVKVEEAGEEKEEDSEKSTKKEGIVEEKKKILATRPVGALVPFANPLADEKVAKKVFKCVKKAASQRTLRRGVKEVVKALRKSPTSSSTENLPHGVVILAADISPMDVISHIPVLSEDHNVPYIYVTSRAELGTAGLTKRPTSVVMVSRDAGKKAGREGKEKETKADGEGDEKESWEETYKGLVKAVEREGRHVKI
ncbi:uncharacterized protein Z519_05729 [Cladophialophora bantiana CBS 173.52]|uniref:Ribosomal protein eL8/eL30/eS12/Gadd45 domain-containing protein n=1 Tax=Cladophialophora bantiana (strain ATCC 10958 / CBS 173.52 / CDC B-1940 / NIH 8579) TaxID=1442370 RepID=A0A0D2I8I3_CLAB1|nr:uncharacterized protein Z519_05729 [Cladophialophora bantiana CBS 173.52]KIW93124.1 hypothetical protein Z519_05729 [Cladophialophora bantiana CBS 173.52]